MRIVNENANSEADWLEWAYKAYESVYAYEFQGDNLLIARINLLLSFSDYLEFKWKRLPNIDEIKKVTDIIVWNLWQMDGLTGLIPFERQSLFNLNEDIKCKIYDWQEKKEVCFIGLE